MSNDRGLSRAQMQYDAQTPPEGERICECSHDLDDHADDPMEQDPTQFLNLVRSVASLLEKKLDNAARMAMDDALTVCGAANCKCRKFVPRESDDGPEE
jgi:hypothetical protein